MILTARLRLRPFKPDDIQHYHARIYGDPLVTRYLPGGAPRPVEGAQKVMDAITSQWAENGIGAWAVEERETGEFAGHCGFYQDKLETIELIYAFGRAFWGKGYATEASHAALRYGFEVGGLEKVLAVAVVDNEASQNVMRKLGMRYDGPAVDYGFDVVRYSMTADEFKAGEALFELEA